MPGDVSVTPVRAGERGLVEGLFQFYAYDFSEFARPESRDFDFDDQGRLASYPHLDSYWSEADRWPLLIRVGGAAAGFALINTHSHRGGRVERNMAEFFVARRFRRRGVAMQAVHVILGMHPGEWEIAVSERNHPARAFWPRALAAAPNVSGLMTHEGDGERWSGPIHAFRAR
jgi:predicted acetyltransferase